MLRGERDGLKLSVVCGFGLSERDVPDRLEQTTVVEPVDLFKCTDFDGLERAPRATTVNHLSRDKADHCLGERVVVEISDAADGGFDTGFSQTFGVADADILDPLSD